MGRVAPVVALMKRKFDILAYGILFLVVTSSSLPPLLSGGKLNLNDQDNAAECCRLHGLISL